MRDKPAYAGGLLNEAKVAFAGDGARGPSGERGLNSAGCGFSLPPNSSCSIVGKRSAAERATEPSTTAADEKPVPFDATESAAVDGLENADTSPLCVDALLGGRIIMDVVGADVEGAPISPNESFGFVCTGTRGACKRRLGVGIVKREEVVGTGALDPWYVVDCWKGWTEGPEDGGVDAGGLLTADGCWFGLAENGTGLNASPNPFIALFSVLSRLPRPSHGDLCAFGSSLVARTCCCCCCCCCCIQS